LHCQVLTAVDVDDNTRAWHEAFAVTYGRGASGVATVHEADVAQRRRRHRAAGNTVHEELERVVVVDVDSVSDGEAERACSRHRQLPPHRATTAHRNDRLTRLDGAVRAWDLERTALR
jgi:hypothetical protein